MSPLTTAPWTLGLALLLGATGPARADGPPPQPVPAPAPAPAPDAKPAPAPLLLDRARLMADVRRLADSDLGARATPKEREQAAQWIADQMAKASLVPPPGGAELLHVHAFASVPEGAHVMAYVKGARSDEVVLVVTHFDGRLPPEKELRPGADAHASGVAALLETARLLAAGPAPRRSVGFVAFDLSAPALAGPRSFVAAPPLDLNRVAAVIAVERVGRSLGDAFSGTTFVHGAETAAGLESAVAAVAKAARTDVRSLRMDLALSRAPDSLPFEERRLPCLLVTGGPSRDDGGADDVVGRIDVAALAARTEILAALVRAVADAPEMPQWRAAPPPSVDEARTAATLLDGLASREADLHLSEEVRTLRAEVAALLAATVKRGTISLGERAALRILLVQILEGLVAPR